MSNICIYFTVSLPFSSRDVSTAISNLLQTTTASGSRLKIISIHTSYKARRSRLKKNDHSNRNVTRKR